MRFWKAFAWIALGWVLVVRRGAGLLLKKTSDRRTTAVETETPEQQSGPTWRRTSSTRVAYPGRSAQPRPEPSGDSAESGTSADGTEASVRRNEVEHEEG